MFHSSSNRPHGAYIQQAHILIRSFDVAQLVELLRYTPQSRVCLPMVLLEIFIYLFLAATLWHWGRLTSNTKEYQQYFLRGKRKVKGGQCVGLTTLLPSCADCFEIWVLRTPGTLKASKGILTLKISILSCPILFEVETDSFHIHNVEESVLRKINFIIGCPIKSNKNSMQNLVFNVEYESICVR